MIEVRHGRHDGIGGADSVSFPTFEEAKDYADWLRDDWDMNVYWVEFDDIAAFAQAMEDAAERG